MNKQDWVWLPHAGHFIGAHKCRFHLNTYANGYLVSTVGEYISESLLDRMAVEGEMDFEDIGLNRKYETMVFRAKLADENSCCPYRMSSATELDMRGYNDPAGAYHGHLAMCEKWAKADD